MLEDASDDLGVDQEREHLAWATAVRADQDFELEDPLHELGPGVPTPLWGGWCERGGVVVFGVVAVTALRGLCVMVVVQRQRHDPIAVRRGRREDPMIGRQMGARPWDERGKAALNLAKLVLIDMIKDAMDIPDWTPELALQGTTTQIFF